MSPSSSPAPPAALQAFLRGIERRAYALAEAQCGAGAPARAALAATLARFRHEAPACPLKDWPMRFWAALLARPELREPYRGRGLPAAYAPLAGLTSGARAALLLRLAAGLDHAHVAAVLGVSTGAARLALVRAMRGLARDEASAGEALRALDDAVHARVRDLPEDERLALAELRDRSLRGETVRLDAGRARGGPILRLLWGAFGLVAVLFVASFFVLPAIEPIAPGETRRLPPVELPPMSPEAAALASPDFDQFVDPAGAALAEDLAFYAWLAAQRDATVTSDAR